MVARSGDMLKRSPSRWVVIWGISQIGSANCVLEMEPAERLRCIMRFGHSTFPLSIRRYCAQLLSVVFVAFLSHVMLTSEPSAQVPSSITEEDLEKLRHRLDELALARVPGPEEELPWEMEASAEIGEMRARQGVVQLVSESYKLGCMWVIRNLSNPKEPVVRALIFHQGKDYVVLDPGDYEITLHAGRADELAIALKPRRVEIRKGNVYRSTFGLDVEDKVITRMKEILDEERKTRGEETE